jgi:hypothetical protein
MERTLDSLEEVWAYDEPHPSGGNIHVTMTKLQAIAFMRACYPYSYTTPEGDEHAFTEWVNVHWAYKAKQQ